MVLIVMSNLKKNGRKNSFFLLVFWTLMVYCTSLIFRSYVLKYNQKVVEYKFT